MKTYLSMLIVLVSFSVVFADVLPGNTPDNPFDPKQYSNGCGGEGITSLVPDAIRIENPVNGRGYVVSFEAACDNHDAGYSGGIIYDRLRGGVKDFRNWSRRQIDDKFLDDMRFICRKTISAQLEQVLWLCLNSSSYLAPGSFTYYNEVRKSGSRFFDADPEKPGLQSVGTRPNN
jgi:hypothetical protein